MRYGDNIQREISYTVLSVCVGQACKDALWSGVITGVVKAITSYTFAVCVKGACVCVCLRVCVCSLSDYSTLWTVKWQVNGSRCSHVIYLHKEMHKQKDEEKRFLHCIHKKWLRLIFWVMIIAKNKTKKYIWLSY